jgi:putative FmdB family regulatory protein
VPLYEYQCKDCGHRFEKIQKFSDPLVTDCPKCGKPSVEQMISAPAVQFKGSGWYVTDYASKKSGSNSGNNASGEGKSGEGKSEAKSETKSDTKSETKSESKSSSGSSSESK